MDREGIRWTWLLRTAFYTSWALGFAFQLLLIFFIVWIKLWKIIFGDHSFWLSYLWTYPLNSTVSPSSFSTTSVSYYRYSCTSPQSKSACRSAVSESWMAYLEVLDGLFERKFERSFQRFGSFYSWNVLVSAEQFLLCNFFPGILHHLFWQIIEYLGSLL